MVTPFKSSCEKSNGNEKSTTLVWRDAMRGNFGGALWWTPWVSYEGLAWRRVGGLVVVLVLGTFLGIPSQAFELGASVHQ